MPGSKDAPANRWQRNDSTLRAAASDPHEKKSSHCERIKTHPSWMPLQPRDERDGRDAHDNDMAVSLFHFLVTLLHQAGVSAISSH